jgi:hypothetical protein
LTGNVFFPTVWQSVKCSCQINKANIIYKTLYMKIHLYHYYKPETTYILQPTKLYIHVYICWWVTSLLQHVQCILQTLPLNITHDVWLANYMIVSLLSRQQKTGSWPTWKPRGNRASGPIGSIQHSEERRKVPKSCDCASSIQS